MMLFLRLAIHRGSINRSFDHSVPTNLHSPEEYILAKMNISDRGSFCLRLATLHLVMPGTKRLLSWMNLVFAGTSFFDPFLLYSQRILQHVLSRLILAAILTCR